MRDGSSEQPGPRILYLCARRAGPVEDWGEWLAEAGRLACDWLWLGELQPRRAGVHPLATAEPGGIPGGSGAGRTLGAFIDAARAQGLKLAADFSPAFVDRAAPLAAEHPRWFVAGPAGTPAVPAGMGPEARAATLAECDFGGPCGAELAAYWGEVAGTILGRGFDALVCRAAHRLSPRAWAGLLAAARRRRPHARFWADTLGAATGAAEALAGLGFEAYLSSACWWDFRGDWFVEQERRLRRLAPTIAFPEEPGGVRVAAGASAAPAEALARFRYRYAAAVAWGVAVPMGYAQGWRRPLGEAGPRERAAFDLVPEIAALNALKAGSAALSGPARLRRLSAAGAEACVLALEPAGAGAPALALLNPAPERHAEVRCGPLFADLDVAAAGARELTPGRTPQRLDPGARVALEPLQARWFEAERAAPETVPADPAQDVLALATAPIAIENVAPRAGAGAVAIKRTLGAEVTVAADLVADGHDRLGAALCYRGPHEADWRETAFEPVENDRWRGRFAPDRIGAWRFRIHAWRDRFGSWRAECLKRRDAGQSLAAELGDGEALLDEAAAAAPDPGDRKHLQALQERLAAHAHDPDACAELLLGETVAELLRRTLPRTGLSVSGEVPVSVERGRAGAGAWYECFPRSLGSGGRHGTFDDLIRHLPYVAELGFDVVYLPPIHPIGRTNRKGRNNALSATPDDPGSPWAIGASEGGHTAVHPALGTLADFRRALDAAHALGLEIALDFAIQCSPDHPWIREHPQWFRWRPDGSIRYAENPPKKYEDIVNVDFYGDERDMLWATLRDVVTFWCKQGVRIFRVDNPHTKPLPFWEWLIASVHARYPETVFLSEAFTRPKVMHRLAQIGFSQSYTYFTWRNTKEELIQYLEELAGEPLREYFRPNFWVNTPDINPYYLHESGRAGFVIRAVLAATMVSSWGMYSGYELCEHEPLRNPDGSAREEYLNSEKYELKHRDFGAPGNICAEISALNRIRRDNPALREEANIGFHPANDGAVLFYSRAAPDDVVWVLVSLDPHNPREADLELPLEMLGANEDSVLAVEDQLGARRWEWRGRHQRVRLEPRQPAMVLRVTRAG